MQPPHSGHGVSLNPVLNMCVKENCYRAPDSDTVSRTQRRDTKPKNNALRNIKFNLSVSLGVPLFADTDVFKNLKYVDLLKFE